MWTLVLNNKLLMEVLFLHKNKCFYHMGIYVYTMHLHIYKNIYIYAEDEREREIEPIMLLKRVTKLILRIKTINISSRQNSTLWFDLSYTCNNHQRLALRHRMFLFVHVFILTSVCGRHIIIVRFNLSGGLGRWPQWRMDAASASVSSSQSSGDCHACWSSCFSSCFP